MSISYPRVINYNKNNNNKLRCARLFGVGNRPDKTSAFVVVCVCVCACTVRSAGDNARLQSGGCVCVRARGRADERVTVSVADWWQRHPLLNVVKKKTIASVQKETVLRGFFSTFHPLFTCSSAYTYYYYYINNNDIIQYVFHVKRTIYNNVTKRGFRYASACVSASVHRRTRSCVPRHA